MPNHHFSATRYNAQARCPFIAHAADIDADPRVRAIRLALYAHRNRASLATIRAVGPPPLPPPRRCQCRLPHRADSSNNEEASDAR
jgi:hypothetical protein